MPDRDDLIEDYKQFTREMLLRFDRAFREMRQDRAELKRDREQWLAETEQWRTESARWRAESAQWRAELREMREASERHFDRVFRELDDSRAENRAQTQALLHILDRLGGGGAATA